MYFICRIHFNRSGVANEYFYDIVDLRGENISRVEAWDLSTDGNGATIDTVFGNIGGNRFIFIFVGDQPGFGVNFEIKFYVDVFRHMEIGHPNEYTGRAIIAHR